MNHNTTRLARALIAAHGDAALAFAEEALTHVRAVGVDDRIAHWRIAIEVIKAVQGGREIASAQPAQRRKRAGVQG